MGRPARTNANFLVNEPDGWVSSNGPVPWSMDVSGGSFWWVGASGGDGPIGPNGPFTGGASAQAVVTRATSMIVDPLTTGPFRVRQVSESDPVGQYVPVPLWLSDPQLLRPDLRTESQLAWRWPAPLRHTRSVFWRDWFTSALHWGKGFLIFQEAADGSPLAGSLRTLHPDLVEDVGESLDTRWRVGDLDFDGDGRVVVGGFPYRLLLLRNPHSPLGVFGQHPQLFALGDRLASYTAGTFRSGVPAGYLKVSTPTFTKDQADALKAAWMAAHGGDTRSIAVLNATTDFTPLSLSPVDSALIEVTRAWVADVAFAFGMAPETLGVGMGGSLTYSNQRDWFEAHRDFGLSTWDASGSGSLSSLLPRGLDVEINLNAYIQPTESQSIADGAAATNAGLITVDEWRADRGLPPLPEPAPIPAQLVPFVEGEVPADVDA